MWPDLSPDCINVTWLMILVTETSPEYSMTLWGRGLTNDQPFKFRIFDLTTYSPGGNLTCPPFCHLNLTSNIPLRYGSDVWASIIEVMSVKADCPSGVKTWSNLDLMTNLCYWKRNSSTRNLNARIPSRLKCWIIPTRVWRSELTISLCYANFQ